MSDKRTYSDRSEYLKKAVTKRRQQIKLMALEYKGSCCQNCGYARSKRALEFHHLDPSQKDFGISFRGLSRSWMKVKAELDKCVLVCSNCHMEIHDGILQLASVTMR